MEQVQIGMEAWPAPDDIRVECWTWKGTSRLEEWPLPSTREQNSAYRPTRNFSFALAATYLTVFRSTYNEKLFGENSPIDQLIKQGVSDLVIIEELYLVALSRFPTEEEQSGLVKLIR